ncbi:MAG: flagellar basal-body rod protein FlgF [Alphaproteobacteria bacterium]|nr:flagellar basal-body rod protein FlgF [Alphaproteobacteria bacterium]
MENISYVGLSQQMALQRRMDMTANNLANMNTPGFKSQNVLFLEYLNQSQQGDQVRQVLDYASYRDLTQGTFQQTFNELDLAIQEDGYFTVDTPEGRRYTKAGSFRLNENREIVTKQGYPLLNESSAPIVVQAEATKITVTTGGEVVTDQGSVGRIHVVGFDNEQDMKAVGNNLYDAIQLQEKPIENPGITQGMIETSNVNPIIEMNKMIEILRKYQATQRMLVTDHERIRSVIQKLTKA